MSFGVYTLGEEGHTAAVRSQVSFGRVQGAFPVLSHVGWQGSFLVGVVMLQVLRVLH